MDNCLRLNSNISGSIQELRSLTCVLQMRYVHGSHVQEPFSDYMLLVQKMWDSLKKYRETWNFGSEATSVLTICAIATTIIAKKWL